MSRRTFVFTTFAALTTLSSIVIYHVTFALHHALSDVNRELGDSNYYPPLNRWDLAVASTWRAVILVGSFMGVMFVLCYGYNALVSYYDSQRASSRHQELGDSVEQVLRITRWYYYDWAVMGQTANGQAYCESGQDNFFSILPFVDS